MNETAEVLDTQPHRKPICCCRSEHVVNAGCRVHGIGVIALSRNLATEALMQRQALYAERVRVGAHH